MGTLPIYKIRWQAAFADCQLASNQLKVLF